jgi:hypothetical protein
MSKPTTKRSAVAILAVGALAYGAYRWIAAPRPSAEDPSLLVDRAWIDSKPQKYTDYMQAFFASSQRPISVFQRASSYDIHLELATFRRDKDKVTMTFPQTDRQASFSYTIRACNDLPPFDLCLDLSENPWGGPKRYYGLRDQGDESRELGKLARVLRAEASE